MPKHVQQPPPVVIHVHRGGTLVLENPRIHVQAPLPKACGQTPLPKICAGTRTTHNQPALPSPNTCKKK